MAEVRLENVTKLYGRKRAVNNVSITCREGEFFSIFGPTGAGKSTILKTISGLLKPRQGTIRLDGEDLTRYPPHEIVTKGVVQVPEGRRIFGRLTVLENLEMGAFSIRERNWIETTLKRVFSLFPRLQERSHQVAGTLSGGEQQMLATGRALMANPRLLLLDEPSMGLAPVLVDNIFETITRLHESGTTILLVEQNARMALQVAGRGYVLQSGIVVLSDLAENLRRNETVRQAYLGEG